MHLRSLPTMERISVPVRRHPEHYFVVQRSVRLIAIILYQGYNTLKQGLFLIKAVTALLRESHTLNKAVTAVFTSKAAARYKAVIVLRHTTALLRDPYCKAQSGPQCPASDTVNGNNHVIQYGTRFGCYSIGIGQATFENQGRSVTSSYESKS